jgi:HEAT repeat protein
MNPPTTNRTHRWLLKTFVGWCLFALGAVVLALLLALGWVVGSVWIENRYPSADAQRALLPGAQQVMTKPVVNLLSRQIERYVRRRAEMLYMNTGLTLEETIARFLDERLDLSQRRIYAYRLARVGSPEAIAALLKVLRTAPPEHKAFMAQLIGSTGNRAAKAWLWPMLNDPNEAVVVAAIRGLSALGDDEITARLAQFLADTQRSERVQIEAAAGLGTIGSEAARVALVEAFGQVPSDDLATQILTSLGQFPFPTVATTFSQYLAAPDTPPELRVTAVESLAYSTTEAVPFLLNLAGADADADVRASAAWAISAHDTVKDLGPTLAGMVQQEPEADVRRRLYEAMLPQAGLAVEPLIPQVLAEDDIAARVAGFNAVGSAAGQQPDSLAAARFDQQMVPELLQIATSENSLNIRMRAVFALRRANTPAAQQALAVIARTATPQIAAAAQHGLPANNQPTTRKESSS